VPTLPSPTPSELIELLPSLRPQERAEIDRLIRTKRNSWEPILGPQAEAYHSPADVLFYGGQAGGGKTDLLLGLALTAHRRCSGASTRS
jgi:hypothetical protein